MIIVPLVFVLMSCVVLAVAFRYASTGLRLPLGIYCGAYLLTTVIGATIIALPGGRELWIEYNGGADTAVLQSFTNARYWFLLYSPLLVPPFVAMTAERIRLLPSARTANRRPPEITLLAFAIVFALFAGYCFFTLSINGYLGDAVGILRLEGDYVSVIQLRADIFSDLGRTFFGLLYVGLPILSHVAFYQALKLREYKWRFAFVFSVFTICILVLLTAQKGPLILYFLSLTIGYSVIRRVRIWAITGAALICLATLNAFQILVVGDWSMLQSAFLVIFRMANAFPYYCSLFPEVLHFTGIDVGLDLVGLVPKPNENEVVFDYMYPDVHWVQGAAPAPAHLAAYAQGGMPFAVATLLLIGIAVAVVASAGRRLERALSYGAYIGGLLFLYYLTQITVRGALITNYGLAWAAVVLLALRSCSSTFRRAAAEDSSIEAAFTLQ